MLHFAQINLEWDILPLFQHLHHDGVELKDNTRTLGDLGVLTDDHIYLLCDEIPEDEVEAIDDEEEDELVAKACAASLAGFNGTALFGLPGNGDQTGPPTREDSIADMMVDEVMPGVAQEDPVQCESQRSTTLPRIGVDSDVLACQVCTFLNRETRYPPLFRTVELTIAIYQPLQQRCARCVIRPLIDGKSSNRSATC